MQKKQRKAKGFTSQGDMVLLPVTMQQFQDLTNEILLKFNPLTAPDYLDAEFMTTVLMSSIHALPHTQGVVSRNELFLACVNRISCRVTYHVVEEIQKKKKAEAEARGEKIDETDDADPASTIAKSPDGPTAVQ